MLWSGFAVDDDEPLVAILRPIRGALAVRAEDHAAFENLVILRFGLAVDNHERLVALLYNTRNVMMSVFGGGDLLNTSRHRPKKFLADTTGSLTPDEQPCCRCG